MNNINDFFSAGNPFGREYMSYVTKKRENIITIIPKSMRIVSDNKGNSKQNVQFEGLINDCELNSRVVLDSKAKIIFPLISFRSALFRFYKSKDAVMDFLELTKEHKIVFKRYSQRNYEIISIEQTKEVTY